MAFTPTPVPTQMAIIMVWAGRPDPEAQGVRIDAGHEVAVHHVVERLNEHGQHHGPGHVHDELPDGHGAHLVVLRQNSLPSIRPKNNRSSWGASGGCAPETRCPLIRLLAAGGATGRYPGNLTFSCCRDIIMPWCTASQHIPRRQEGNVGVGAVPGEAVSGIEPPGLPFSRRTKTKALSCRPPSGGEGPPQIAARRSPAPLRRVGVEGDNLTPAGVGVVGEDGCLPGVVVLGAGGSVVEAGDGVSSL